MSSNLLLQVVEVEEFVLAVSLVVSVRVIVTVLVLSRQVLEIERIGIGM
jgi:hypothetical protein